MPVREEVSYRIRVSYEPGRFEEGMDCITKEPEDALSRLKALQEKYPGREITIKKTTMVEFKERISQNDLELDVDRASD